MGFALCLSPSSLDRQALRSGPEGCAGPGVPTKSRGSNRKRVPGGADFVGWDGAPNVPDGGGVLEGGACPPLPTSMGFALCLSPSSLDRQALRSGPEGCAGPGVPTKSRGSNRKRVPGGADFVGWDGAPNVPDGGGVLEGGACPPLPTSMGFALCLSPSSLDRQALRSGPKGCAGPGVPTKSRGSTRKRVPGGADFVGWDGAPSVPDGGGFRKGGPAPPSTSLVLPIPGSLNRLLPLGAALRALLLGPAGLPGAVHLPVAAQLVQAVPEAHGQPGRVRCAQRGRLADGRPHDGRAQDVGLELHQEAVLDHAAVHLERLDLDAGVLLHRLGDVEGLVADGLQ